MYKFIRIIAIPAAIIFLGIIIAPYIAQAQGRVVFHMSESDPAKWELVLNNARNVRQELGKGAQIEIVALGPGLDMVKIESAAAPRLAQALDAGMRLIACENTMRVKGVAKDDIYGGVDYTASGITHIMQRQHEGWAYIRP